MSGYHLRRQEKAITDENELMAIIQGQKYLTLAMCHDNKPYLVSLNYAFDAATRCFYMHCAGQGKKLDWIQANPLVWGQVLEDLGYCAGKCDHGFRSVHFWGHASLVQDPEAKRAALCLMIDQLEPDPEPVKKKLVTDASLKSVTILCVQMQGCTGKQSRPGGSA